MKCFIIDEEINDEECKSVCDECYKKRSGKELPKKFKRVMGWNAICKTCKYHQKPKK